MISRTTHPNYTPEGKARRAARARRATDTATWVRPNAAEGMAKVFNQDNPATQATQATGNEG